MSELNLDGMSLGPGVAETIVAMAAKDVEGVVAVGQASSGFLKLPAKPASDSIDVVLDENGGLNISIRLTVRFGYALPEIAENVRKAVAEAVLSQLGKPVNCIDVYIDDIQFG
ncbi:MAG: Asp23/Gls24 family envelope stress response protein [Eggerthellaceae bacterium]|jgi:uncharacterized alkaline shock family protein YloU